MLPATATVKIQLNHNQKDTAHNMNDEIEKNATDVSVSLWSERYVAGKTLGTAEADPAI